MRAQEGGPVSAGPSPFPGLCPQCSEWSEVLYPCGENESLICEDCVLLNLEFREPVLRSREQWEAAWAAGAAYARSATVARIRLSLDAGHDSTDEREAREKAFREWVREREDR